MENILFKFSIFLFIIVEFIQSLTYDPFTHRTGNDIWGDELVTPTESNRWIMYAWTLKNTGAAGYRDETLGVFYQAYPVSNFNIVVWEWFWLWFLQFECCK